MYNIQPNSLNIFIHIMELSLHNPINIHYNIIHFISSLYNIQYSQLKKKLFNKRKKFDELKTIII
jgi:hypothetical protein